MRVRTVSAVGVAAITLALITGCVAAPTPAAPTPAPTTPAPTTPSPSIIPSPTSTPAPTAASSATAPSTPSPSGAADAYSPNDPNTWTIDLTGIGPFTIGAPIGGATSAITFLQPAADCDNPSTSWYSDTADRISFAAMTGAGDAIDVVTVDGARGGPGTGPRTAEGIHAGSTVEELLAAYPQAQSHESGNGPTYFIGDGRTWMNFYPNNGVITIIWVGTRLTPPKEFCA